MLNGDFGCGSWAGVSSSDDCGSVEAERSGDVVGAVGIETRWQNEWKSCLRSMIRHYVRRFAHEAFELTRLYSTTDVDDFRASQRGVSTANNVGSDVHNADKDEATEVALNSSSDPSRRTAGDSYSV